MVETHIRWMIRRDMEQVLAIEREAFASPWTLQDFFHQFKHRDAVGMVASDSPRAPGKVYGFMIYRPLKTRLRIVNFAVAKQHRRRGVGRAMAELLASKLDQEHRTQILLDEREASHESHLFWRSVGFKTIAARRYGKGFNTN